MKKESGSGWVSAAYALAVVAVFVELTLYMHHSRAASYQQSVGLAHQNNSVAFQAILQDTVVYAQKNPGIEPVLSSIGVVRNANPAANPARR